MATKGKKMMWDGRFDCGMAQSMIDLSFSLDFDKELLEEDIQGSLGHGKGLVESGVLSKSDYAKISKGLQSILADVHAGKNLWLFFRFNFIKPPENKYNRQNTAYALTNKCSPRNTCDSHFEDRNKYNVDTNI